MVMGESLPGRGSRRPLLRVRFGGDVEVRQSEACDRSGVVSAFPAAQRAGADTEAGGYPFLRDAEGFAAFAEGGHVGRGVSDGGQDVRTLHGHNVCVKMSGECPNFT